MGKFPRNFCDRALINSILPADIHDLHAQASGQSKHTNDVYTDAGELRLGR